jgi:PPE-repeat protein
MDYGSLPPEVNSGRMYAGAGSAPLAAAAAGWDGLATELRSAAESYAAVIKTLGACWLGPSSAAMAAAAAPYTAWLTGTAGQAEHAANQARAALAAYETAFAATVPPPQIANNRARLHSLLATNVFGQNIPAIMATETTYTEMWAQDAAAMHGYAGSTATATQLTPFSQPPHTTNHTGPAADAAAGTHAQTTPPLISAIPQALQSLTTPAQAGSGPSLLAAINEFIIGPLSPVSYSYFVVPADLLAFDALGIPLEGAAIMDRLTAASGGSTGLLGLEFDSGLSLAGTSGVHGAPALVNAAANPVSAVSADMGRSGLVGELSVPPSWASSAPTLRPAATALPHSTSDDALVPAAVAADGQGSLFRDTALSSLVGRAVAGTGAAPARSGEKAGAVAVGQRATTANIFFVTPEDDNLFTTPETDT